MRLGYTLGIRFYALLVCLASPFNAKAKKWILGRVNLWEQLPQLDRTKPLLWFHCASLGEFDMALPIMSELKKSRPKTQLLVTFFSPSGMEHYHKRDHQVDFISYLPLDTPSNARRFIDHYQPKAVFFVKYEFWSNFIFVAKQEGLKVYSVCALFREKHRFFKWYGGFFRKTLRSIDFFFVQNEQSAELLRKIRINNFLVTGDTRYDRVIENSKKAKSNEAIETFLQGEKAWIFGSTWPADESLLKCLTEIYPQQKMIFAPHDVSTPHIMDIEKSYHGRSCLLSKPDPAKQVLILNSIGNLTDAYAYGEIAYVGGGFSGKLHNILEPSVFGLPVIFGPKFGHFPEASEFIDAGIGFSVRNEDELLKTVHKAKSQLELVRVKSKAFLEDKSGASKRICDNLSLP